MSNTTKQTLIEKNHRFTAKGVSLIELMISIVIGSLLIAGAATVYSRSRSSYRTSEALARLQETGRYALDTIDADIRLAGLWGLTMYPDMIANKGTAMGSNACGNNWTVDADKPIDGSNNSYGLTCTGTSPVAWGDVLVSRRTSADPTPLTNNVLQIQTTRTGGTFFVNGTLPAGYAASPASATYDVIDHAYYVSEVAAPTTGGLKHWILRRKALIAGPAIQDDEIINGIQDLQVQFGVAKNGDGNASLYINPGTAPSGPIVSVRVWVLVVADDTEPGFSDTKTYDYADVQRNNTSPASTVMFNDGRRRILFSKTIKIRNSKL